MPLSVIYFLYTKSLTETDTGYIKGGGPKFLRVAHHNLYVISIQNLRCDSSSIY